MLHSQDAFALKARGKHPEPAASEVHVHPVETALGPIAASLTYVTGSSRAAERELERLTIEVRPDWIHHHNISLLGQGLLSVGSVPKLFTSHDHWLACPRSDLAYLGKEKCVGGSCNYCSLRSGRPPQLWRMNGSVEKVGVVDRMIAPSHYMASFLKERLGISSMVLPNFVPRPDEVANPGPRDHFVFAGVLEPHKGLDLLLKGYELCDVRSELHVLGRGSLEPMVSEYGGRTGGRIRALGFLGRKELLAEVSSAIAILSPSTCQENSPLSCIEALSVGTPLIVSANGGLPELVADGAGIVTDTTAESIGSAMRMLERQEGMRSTFSGNALRRYEDVHTPERYLRAYMELAEVAG